MKVQGAVLVLSAILALTHAQYFGNYNCVGDRDVFVHLFEWRWADVARECEEFLADAGYCAVQISPAGEHRIMINWQDAGIDYPWYQRYQPVSYGLDSRSGTEAEFRDMVDRCNAVGVRIYADVVINHMANDGSGVGSGGTEWDSWNFFFPGVPYGPLDFHGSDVCFTPDMTIWNYGNANEVRYCWLERLRDLRQSLPYVQDQVVGYLNKLIDAGVAGFRIDASKHMFTDHMSSMFSRLNNLREDVFGPNELPFLFMEVIDLGTEPIRGQDYTFMGRVTEFKHGMQLGDVVRKNGGRRLAELQFYGEGWDNFLPGLSAVTFLDNHDNQRGHGAGGFNVILSFFEDHQYKIANAFQLAWPYGYVKLMSSYMWPRTIIGGSDLNDWMGPPSEPAGVTKPVECFNGEWICEHRWRQHANMVKFHNSVVGTLVQNWWDNGFNAIAFSRGDKGFIVINNENFEINQNYFTGLPDGEYCNVITCENNRPINGDCGETGDGCQRVTISGGFGFFSVPNNANPVFAIHV